MSAAIADYARLIEEQEAEYEKQVALEHAAAVDAGEVDPRAGKQSRLRRSTLNLRDLMTTQLPPADWVLWPFVERGQQAALVAPAKAGKSLVVLEAVLAAAEGRPTFGHPVTRPSKVLYLDAENTARDLQRRLHALQATEQALAACEGDIDAPRIDRDRPDPRVLGRGPSEPGGRVGPE